MRKSEKITALYERLSRDDFGKDDDQQRESNSISNQKTMLEEFAARQGLWNRTNEHLVTYLNLCLQVVFLTCEIYIGLYNLCNFNVAISIILIVELMIDVVIGLKLFHNQSI